jgi:hypothetical protein
MANTTKSSGIGLTGVLFIVFLVLKLTGNINWSWLWVLSPIWIPIALFIGFVLIFVLIFIVAIALGHNPNKVKMMFKKKDSNLFHK